ncbi:MAG: flagellar assembly protein FliW [Actinobacteria bacterium]|nr:flagellar assembly protein FliW [Actinomycetota bacterium]
MDARTVSLMPEEAPEKIMAKVEMTSRVKFATTRFGVVEIDEDKIIRFVESIPGFPDAKEFVLIPHKENSPLAWLQSTELADVAFVVIEPWAYFKDYNPAISEWDLEKLEAAEEGEADCEASLLVLSILTIPGDPKKITANLTAPIIINLRNNLAIQVILAYDGYMTKHPLISEA